MGSDISDMATGKLKKGLWGFAHLIFLLWVIVGLSSCRIKKYERDRSRKLVIVTTTGIIKDIVKNIVGDKATVYSLMGPGVDPHLYKASHGDLEMLTNADIIFYNGLHLEGKMGEVLEKLNRIKPVIAVSKDIDRNKLTKTGEGSYDPHIWFDVNLWSNTVPVIEREVIKYDGLNKDFYEKNAKRYLGKLDSLHAWIKIRIRSIPSNQRILITAHDAFGYFGKAYDIRVRGLQGISTVAEFGLHDITDLVDLISASKVKAVFVETSVSQKAINAVLVGCNERGHQLKIGGSLYSDALGADNSEAGSYIGMVKSNVNTIVEALK